VLTVCSCASAANSARVSRVQAAATAPRRGDTVSLTIEAPQIAHRVLTGQFVVVRVNESGSATVILAMGAARKAADDVHAYLGDGGGAGL
jgi:hypothetical protein